MLQARMATRVAKPNGQFWLRPDDVASFMLDKKVTDLPGKSHLSVFFHWRPTVFSLIVPLTDSLPGLVANLFSPVDATTVVFFSSVAFFALFVYNRHYRADCFWCSCRCSILAWHSQYLWNVNICILSFFD